MSQVLGFRPLLTATHRYDKSLSTRHRGMGEIIEAPILSYLIETRQGRILYDLGCDYRKLSDPALRARYYDPESFSFGPPDMDASQCLPNQLERLGLRTADIDLVVLGHLHFDHAGGLCDFCHSEIHVQAAELNAAEEPADPAYFPTDYEGDHRWRICSGEYDLLPGVRVVSTPGHTAGHTSLWIELPQGRPILLAGDAADLQENLNEEIAPGLCWQEREDIALSSIRKLKRIAVQEDAELWPNHDINFWHLQSARFHEGE